MAPKRDELQAQYDLLSRKIGLMREMLVVETRVEEKLRYEKLIEQAERERDEIELALESIEEEEHTSLLTQGAFQKKKLVLNPIGQSYEIHCIFDTDAEMGRSPECDFSLAQAPSTVSNWHARIRYVSKANEYYVQDLESANGTFVDGNRVTQSMRLSLGSRIHLGKTLSFLFEHYKDAPQATGSLIYYTPEGKELARYIIVPKEKVLVGNASNEAIRLPFVQPGNYLGCIIRKSEGFFFVDDTIEESSSELRLENGMELELGSLNVRVSIPK